MNDSEFSNWWKEWVLKHCQRQEDALPPLQFIGYWEKEFAGAYGSQEGKEWDWDGKVYKHWNDLMNKLAEEGEKL